LLDNNSDIPGDAINVACGGGYKDIVEILIKHNVDINLSGGVFEHTPIYYVNNIIRNVTIIVKQNLYNICMTFKTGIVYWCLIKIQRFYRFYLTIIVTFLMVLLMKPVKEVIKTLLKF
jgi:hypothetical protein